VGNRAPTITLLQVTGVWLLVVQVKKADDCIGPEVEKAVKELQNGEVCDRGEIALQHVCIHAVETARKGS
jgi:3-phosphoglycerate kinase